MSWLTVGIVKTKFIRQRVAGSKKGRRPHPGQCCSKPALSDIVEGCLEPGSGGLCGERFMEVLAAAKPRGPLRRYSIFRGTHTFSIIALTVFPFLCRCISSGYVSTAAANRSTSSAAQPYGVVECVSLSMAATNCCRRRSVRRARASGSKLFAATRAAPLRYGTQPPLCAIRRGNKIFRSMAVKRVTRIAFHSQRNMKWVLCMYREVQGFVDHIVSIKIFWTIREENDTIFSRERLYCSDQCIPFSPSALTIYETIRAQERANHMARTVCFRDIITAPTVWNLVQNIEQTLHRTIKAKHLRTSWPPRLSHDVSACVAVQHLFQEGQEKRTAAW